MLNSNFQRDFLYRYPKSFSIILFLYSLTGTLLTINLKSITHSNTPARPPSVQYWTLGKSDFFPLFSAFHNPSMR